MKKNLFLVLIYFVVISFNASAQVCPTDLLSGQNIIVNGDFSEDYTGWDYTHDSDENPNTGPDGYVKFTSGFSVPGYLFVGTGAQMPAFNNAFSQTFNDHSPSGDDKFLMIDGVCIFGVKIWKQDVPVKPNTTYYFSVWVNSLKDNPNYYGKLNFDVNGVNIGNIDAPALGGANPSSSGWVPFEVAWPSGSNPPPFVTISIEGRQLVGCGGTSGESDFALDDISFIPGCQYGSAGPQPNLGPDKTLCGLGVDGMILNAGVPVSPTTSILWSDGSTGYTLPITTAGTYSVCVSDNGSCTKSDVIVISDVFSIDLGPDRELCDPASVTLDAHFTGVGVTYKWFKDGIAAEGINTNKTYFVNTPGTYKVEVTDPICGLQTSDVIITTKAPQVTNKVYCDPGNITLNVTPANNGKYKWWTSPTSTAPADMVQKGGDSYTFAATPTADYTFYVQDTASFRIPVGLPLNDGSTNNGLTNPQPRGMQGDTELKFDALTAITIDSVYIDLKVYYCPSTFNVGVQVLDASRNVIGSAIWTTPVSGCSQPGAVYKMPVNITVPAGTGYILRYIGDLDPSTGNGRGNSTPMSWYDGGMTYPQTYGDAVKFTGNSNATSMPGMYRWIVTAGTACARVPVQALYKSCVPPIAPIADAGIDIELCNTHTTQLNATPVATDERGEWRFATGSLGAVNPQTSPTGTLTFTGDTVYVIWTVTNTTSGLFDSDTVMVTTTIVPAPTITAPAQTCPSTAGIVFTASPDNTSTGSTYQWEVVSGDIAIVSGDNTYQLTADAGVVESVVKVTETKNGCPASSTHTLNMAPPNDVANAGSDQTICTTSTTLTGNIPVNGTGEWIAMTSDPNQILTQVPPNAATVSNLSTNTIYQYMYEIKGACGNPSQAVIQVTVGAGNFKITSISQPLDTVCVGSERELQAFVNTGQGSGSGSYTYVWTKKGTTQSVEKTVSTYTITTSAISETYYLYVKDNIHSGCVTDLDSVKIASIDFQKLSVPNLITPNGDGLNDVLKISEVGNLNKPMLAKGSTLSIYNRWGNEVFSADNYNNDWNAINTSDGMYYYYLKAGCGGEEHKSWIQILGNAH